MNEVYVCKRSGEVIFHDPGLEMVPVFSTLDPSYRIGSIKPPNGFRPKFQSLREKFIYLERSPLEYDPSYLLEVVAGTADTNAKGDKYSVLDILYANCLMTLKNCSLCGWNCGVNRFIQETGKCGQGSTAHCKESFTHIAEENVINTALVTNLHGCALRCKYCIDHEFQNGSSNLAPLDSREFWSKIEGLILENREHTNTLEFTNPTESFHGILNLLLNAPGDFRLPVVMNAHLYGSARFYKIANPAVDVWVVSFPYGNNDCAQSLSGVEGYLEQAKIGLDSICNKGNRVIIRILVLPGGHVSCCHEPVLELLSQYRDHIWVSILDQYVPEHEAHLNPVLSRRPTRGEIEAVEKLVTKHGLRNITDAGREFWI